MNSKVKKYIKPKVKKETVKINFYLKRKLNPYLNENELLLAVLTSPI